MKLKSTDLAKFRTKLMEEQGNRCAICYCSFEEVTYHTKKKKNVYKHTPCLDHDHKTGQVRGVLCSGCNSAEGKYINAIERWHTEMVVTDKIGIWEMTQCLSDYYHTHVKDQHDLIHPSFKTEDEKRELRNLRARRKRAKTC